MTTVERKPINCVVEHDLALKVYLDSLLFEDVVGDADTEEQPSVPEAIARVVMAEPVSPPVAEDAKSIIQTEAIAEQTESVATSSPNWSNNAFECLMFTVAGSLILSVPLTRLNGILPWEGNITPVPGYAEWFLGLLQNRGKQVKVIDIAKFVIPKNHKARASLVNEREFKHIVLIDGGKFGLACDGLGDVLTLNKAQVRWRTDYSHRPWLAGTVIEHMSALIDIDQFVMMLKDDKAPDDIT